MTKIFIFTIHIIVGLTLLNINVLAQKQIELGKRWGFIKPCITTKAEIEKVLGNSINENKTEVFQTYETKTEKITVVYSDKRNDKELCSGKSNIGTVIRFFVIPFDEIKLSELKVDLSNYKKDSTYAPREVGYSNELEGILIVTKIVEVQDKSEAEVVTYIGFNPKYALRSKSKKEVTQQKAPETEYLLTDKDLLQRVDDLYLTLYYQPYAQGFIINYGNAQEVNELKSRIIKAIKFRNLDLSRVTFLKGSSNKKHKMEFKVVPKGSPPPIPKQ